MATQPEAMTAPPAGILRQIESALQERSPRREGAELRFLCPAHNDHNPSARWHPEKAVWHCDACRTGGGWQDLAERLGLKNGRGSAPHIATVYDYCGADGHLVYQVCRMVPKNFRFRRPNGSGGWVWTLKGVDRVLYRLPDVVAAVRGGRTVYVVEGEKDADALATLGLCATTNPGGAGKWRDGDSNALAGADVVVLPDNDEPGRTHAEAVAKSLHGLGCRVRVVNLPMLPAKGDVSDWLAAGHTVDELRALVDGAAAPWAPNDVPKAGGLVFTSVNSNSLSR